MSSNDKNLVSDVGQALQNPHPDRSNVNRGHGRYRGVAARATPERSTAEDRRGAAEIRGLSPMYADVDHAREWSRKRRPARFGSVEFSVRLARAAR